MCNRKPAWLQYVLLGPLLTAAVIYNAAATWQSASQQAGAELRYAIPFTLKEGSRMVASLTPAALEAGLRPDDEILAVDGEPLRGTSTLVELRRSPIALDIARAGRTIRIEVPARMVSLGLDSTQLTIIRWVMRVVMPWLCLLLGAWAVAIRPRDPQAWLLFVLMMAFPEVFNRPLSLGFAAMAYNTVMRAVFPCVVVLFGLYFAERLRLDVRYPWIKWLFLGPAVVTGAASVVLTLLRSRNFLAYRELQAALEPAAGLFFAITFLSIGIFFMVLGMKVGMSENADARRRLRLLLIGTQVAMTPMFVILIASFLLNRPQLDFVAPWVLTIALLFLFLFPATITYVIVVHRALDVRVVVRQGIQYTLARGGARFLMFALAGVVLGTLLYVIEDPMVKREQRLAAAGSAGLALVVLSRLRTRAAAWIDRRFFRQAYDAERVLSDLSEQVRTIVDSNTLVRRVGETISETLFVPRLAVLLGDNGTFRPAYSIGYDETPPVSFAHGAATVRQVGASPARVYFDDESNWIYSADGMTADEREMLRRLDTQLILPLSTKDRLLGFISLGQKRSEEPYSRADLRLLGSVAAQTGLALENSQLAAAYATQAAEREKLNRELEIAREVQERLFPQRIPLVAGYDLAAGCRPALEVGGDYYDFLTLPDGRIGLVIGDVAGKGIAAALLMASLQASVRGQTLHRGVPLAETIARVNSLIYEASTSSRYATLFYAELDPASGQLDYVNAGHNPPMLLRASGTVDRLEAGGTVVGLLPRFPYQQGQVMLGAGDLLVAFTDGISEAENAAQEDWGEEPLLDAIRRGLGLRAADLLNHLMREADAFAAGAEQHDDMTVLVMRCGDWGSIPGSGA